MKVLQTIAGFGALSGGTSTCTYDLLRAMHRQGAEVDLLTLASDDPANPLMGQGESWIKALPNDARTPYGLSAGMGRALHEARYDVYHTNGLWMYANHATAVAARRQGRPFVLTPHGMLYPEALKRSYWKKWPLIQLYFRRDVAEATCLHVTCRREMEVVRQFGYRGPVAVIANPVPFPPYVETIFEERRRGSAFLGCSLPRKLGFLGRLHPRKKVENLLYGVALAGKEAAQSQILIIGRGDDRYGQFLRQEAARLGLKNVQFMGFVNGEAKYRLLSELSCLFVPSDMENFGMIVTEALSVGTPVMASLGTPWEELNTHRCGWWVDRAPESVAEVIRQALTLPYSELMEMGTRGRQLVQERYADDKVAAQMIRLYSWIVEGGERPEFVYV